MQCRVTKKLSCTKSCGELHKAGARDRIEGNSYAMSHYKTSPVSRDEVSCIRQALDGVW